MYVCILFEVRIEYKRNINFDLFFNNLWIIIKTYTHIIPNNILIIWNAIQQSIAQSNPIELAKTKHHE